MVVVAALADAPDPDQAVLGLVRVLEAAASVQGEADALRAAVPSLTVNCVGMRLPILRETRMPAVMCSLGPFDVITQHGPEVAEAIASVLTQQ